MLEISPRDLDADCFALNTPEATYDLRKGLAGAREHSSEDFITKITSVTPGQKGQKIWQDCLDLGSTGPPGGWKASSISR